MVFANFKINSNETYGKRVTQAGKYNLQLTTVKNVTSQNTGNDYITLGFKVVDGEFADIAVNSYNLNWTDSDDPKKIENSAKLLNTLLIALGFEDGAVIKDWQALINYLGKASQAQKKLNATLQWEEYKDKEGATKYALRINPFTFAPYNAEVPSAPNGETNPGNKGNQNNMANNNPFIPMPSDEDMPF